LVVLNAINLPDSVANLYFRPPSPDLQTLLYTTLLGIGFAVTRDELKSGGESFVGWAEPPSQQEFL